MRRQPPGGDLDLGIAGGLLGEGTVERGNVAAAVRAVFQSLDQPDAGLGLRARFDARSSLTSFRIAMNLIGRDLPAFPIFTRSHPLPLERPGGAA
jgi:hypothetical protein